MSRPFPRPRTIGLLAGIVLNAGLLAWVNVLVRSGGAIAIGKADWNADVTGAIANPALRKPIESYAPILAHPVFSRSRARYVPAPVVAPTVMARRVVVDPGLAVAGVLITKTVSKAYLSSKVGPAGAWTGEGEAFQGWKVRSIDQTSVKLEQNGRLIELSLYPRN